VPGSRPIAPRHPFGDTLSETPFRRHPFGGSRKWERQRQCQQDFGDPEGRAGISRIFARWTEQPGINPWREAVQEEGRALFPRGAARQGRSIYPGEAPLRYRHMNVASRAVRPDRRARASGLDHPDCRAAALRGSERDPERDVAIDDRRYAPVGIEREISRIIQAAELASKRSRLLKAIQSFEQHHSTFWTLAESARPRAFSDPLDTGWSKKMREITRNENGRSRSIRLESAPGSRSRLDLQAGDLRAFAISLGCCSTSVVRAD
jgi:hypothetical protein